MAPRNREPRGRPIVLGSPFLGTALVGSLTMALVSTLAPLPAQVAVLGAFVSVLGGLFVTYLEREDERERRRAELLERLRIPVALAAEHELFDQYSAIAEALAELATQGDPVLKRFALLKLASISDQVRSLARGSIVFSSTEAWRTVYEQLLEGLPETTYRSVAWVKVGEYWQDPPGRQSMRLNFDLVRRGLRIERLVILRDGLWPGGDRLPTPSIRPWIERQHDRGIAISLVRESEIAGEPELLADFGIYGDRAVGVQELDDRARTVRFVLDFTEQAIRLAVDRWDRTALYATPYGELLDREAAGP